MISYNCSLFLPLSCLRKVDFFALPIISPSQSDYRSFLDYCNRSRCNQVCKVYLKRSTHSTFWGILFFYKCNRLFFSWLGFLLLWYQAHFYVGGWLISQENCLDRKCQALRCEYFFLKMRGYRRGFNFWFRWVEGFMRIREWKIDWRRQFKEVKNSSCSMNF